MITSYQTAADFVVEHHVAAETPVARLDGLTPAVESDFTVFGPMPSLVLQPGTIATNGRPIEPYRGQSWQQIDMLSHVSLDVYLTLVYQVGGFVCLARDVVRA